MILWPCYNNKNNEHEYAKWLLQCTYKQSCYQEEAQCRISYYYSDRKTLHFYTMLRYEDVHKYKHLFLRIIRSSHHHYNNDDKSNNNVMLGLVFSPSGYKEITDKFTFWMTFDDNNQKMGCRELRHINLLQVSSR